MGNAGGEGTLQMKKIALAGGGGCPPEMEWSVSCDKTLARLFDMGYDIENSRRAIRECGPSDLSALIDHLSPEGGGGAPSASATAETAPAPALPLQNGIVEERNGASLSSALNSTALNVQHKGSELGECSRGAPKHPSPISSDSASTGNRDLDRGKSLVEDSDDDDRGKNIMEDFDDDEMGLDRWEYDDDDGADRESSLLRMGFSQEDVTAALDTLGVDTDLNKLANYIMNNMVDLPDPSWEDYEAVGEGLGYLGDMEETSRDGLSREPTEQELSLLRKMRNMGFSFQMRIIADAVKACGKDTREEELVDYLLKADERTGVAASAVDLEGSNKTKVELLRELGSFSQAACLRAIDNNPAADICELLDYLAAERLSEIFVEEEEQEQEDEEEEEEAVRKQGETSSSNQKRKRSFVPLISLKKFKRVDGEIDEVPRFHRNLKGFGIPGERTILRQLSPDIASPPYFYFENVAFMPNNEWSNISRHLFNIAPEFVDSLNFSPCRRPRGYIHNLPLEGREDILARPPMTIRELIPGSSKFWPSWDPRTKLNTINTRTATQFVKNQMKIPLSSYARGEVPSDSEIKEILGWAKRWNLVWIRPQTLAPLRPDEVEICLGFDLDHTRELYSMVNRMRALGNSFQVNTVAYHLSVLRPLYPRGIRVLSLFSGIGGAEVALHKLGIFLKVVVSVEKEESSRRVLETWWRTTNQRGTLIHHIWDVKDLDETTLAKFVQQFGGFDLIIGGSPCNNLSGNNRVTRVGLQGPVSVAFFEFPRVVKRLRELMGAPVDY